jgi:MFS family permease
MFQAHLTRSSLGVGTLPAASPESSTPSPSARSQYGLDILNFFIADVQTGFGPFLAVYLTVHGWTHGMIGSVLTASTATAVVSQTPAGMLVDWTRSKRAVVAIGLLLTGAGAVLLALLPRYTPVLIAELLQGVPSGAIRNAVAAIGLGLVGHRAYNTRTGRNHRYDSFGNALTAVAMGGLGALVSLRSPFFAAAGLCLPAILALSLIRGNEIDYRRARGAGPRRSPRPARWRHLIRDRRYRVLSAGMFLFQFANASILLLGAERLAADQKMHSEIVTSAMVAVPQFVSGIIALRVSRAANEWGRKPFILAGFVAVLTRAILFAVAPGPWFLVAVQSLDGITAAVIGIMLPLAVADITRGTGRYNATLGAVGTISMIGAALSTTAIGFVADRFGLASGFTVLAAAALAGLILLWWRMPETVRYAMMEA